MGKNDSVKGLVLASVFMECYLRQRELTVSELLASHLILDAHYGRRPHVLSNVLRRYRKLGLLYRKEDYVRGHPYRYNLTNKGFNRLSWMFQNSGRYLYRGADLLKPLGPALVFFLEKRKFENNIQDLRRLQGKLRASGRVDGIVRAAKAEVVVQGTESLLKARYNEAKLSVILIALHEKYRVQYQELGLRRFAMSG
jgi:hypothetical protein